MFVPLWLCYCFSNINFFTMLKTNIRETKTQISGFLSIFEHHATTYNGSAIYPEIHVWPSTYKSSKGIIVLKISLLFLGKLRIFHQRVLFFYCFKQYDQLFKGFISFVSNVLILILLNDFLLPYIDFNNTHWNIKH